MEKRVIITRPVVGIAHMQVCVVADATDEEILDVCNREAPSGTMHGWSRVCRTKSEYWGDTGPVKCDNDTSRTHFLVEC